MSPPPSRRRVRALRQSNFKTCQQSGFCRRQRRFAVEGGAAKEGAYLVVPGTLRMDESAGAAPAVVADLEQDGRLYTFSVGARTLPRRRSEIGVLADRAPRAGMHAVPGPARSVPRPPVPSAPERKGAAATTLRGQGCPREPAPRPDQRHLHRGRGHVDRALRHPGGRHSGPRAPPTISTAPPLVAYARADACRPYRGRGSQHTPFALEIREEGQPLYQFNHRGFLKIEYLRTKEDIVRRAATRFRWRS